MDVADPAEARRLAETLGDSVHFYKLGLELFMVGRLLRADRLDGRARQEGLRDLKFFDVPATVAAAGPSTAQSRRDRSRRCMATKGSWRPRRPRRATSGAGRDGADRASIAATSMTSGRLRRRAAGAVPRPPRAGSGLRRRRPRRGLEAAEAARVHRSPAAGRDARHPVRSRIARWTTRSARSTVAQAFANGADYIVVGRPIRDRPIRGCGGARESSRRSPASSAGSRSDGAAAERPAAACAAAPAHAPHAAVDDEAGRRYLPEYRATRAKAGSFLQLCMAPELACEVTLQPSIATVSTPRSCSRTS